MAANSPMFRGDPAHTGVYAAPDQPIAGKIAWSFQGVNYGLFAALEGLDGSYKFPTTPAVVDDRIYYCIGPFLFVVDEAGKEVYHVKLSAGTLASPAVVGGILYVPTNDGKLHALDAANGLERWTATIGPAQFLNQVDNWDVFHSSAVVVDGMLYIGSVDGRIYALSAAEGKELWHFQTQHVVRATPAVADGRVYCGSFDGKVYALDAKTGNKIWEVSTKTKGIPWHAVQGSCATAGGLVYVGSRSGFLYAIEAATGEIRWRDNHHGNWMPSSPAVRDGVAYVGQSDGCKITAVGPEGKPLWVYSAPNETFASPALAGDVLYAATNDNYNLKGKGSLSALDIKSGKARWTLEFPASIWSSPVVVGGTVYIGCADGKLYAVR